MNILYFLTGFCAKRKGDTQIMDKKPFVTLEQLREIERTYPTPFYLYDEKGIRENAARLKQAFSWNRGYKEYFAVKATPNPFLLNILKDMGCGTDCSSMTELMMSRACGFSGSDIMFSSNDTPLRNLPMRKSWEPSSTWTTSLISSAWRKPWDIFRRPSAAVLTRAVCLKSAMI